MPWNLDADTRVMLSVILGQFIARIVGLGIFIVPAWVGIRAASHLERETSEWDIRAELIFLALVFYLVIVAAATIVPLQKDAVSGTGGVSLIPGTTTIGCYRRMTGTPVELVICNMQLVGNILLFAPLGLLLPLVSRRFASFRAVLVVAAPTSMSIEAIQYLQKSLGAMRSVDIDDVILNVVGALLGYLLIRQMMGSKARDRGVATGR